MLQDPSKKASSLFLPNIGDFISLSKLYSLPSLGQNRGIISLALVYFVLRSKSERDYRNIKVNRCIVSNNVSLVP